MQVKKEFTPQEKSSVKLTVTIGKEDVVKSYKDALAKIAKEIQLPGFRKGHVPANVLERKYGEALKADALGEIIDSSLNEIFQDDAEKDNRPLPYSQPVLEGAPVLDLEKDLTYTVKYDVFPKVQVKNFGGINVKEPQVNIGDKELQAELKNIQERNATIEDRPDDQAAQKGDIVTVDYIELDKDGVEVAASKRDGYVFTIGEADAYGISDDIVGMKKGDTKEAGKKDKK